MAYICGFGGDRDLIHSIKYKWKMKRDGLINNGNNDPGDWARCRADVIRQQGRRRKFKSQTHASLQTKVQFLCMWCLHHCTAHFHATHLFCSFRITTWYERYRTTLICIYTYIHILNLLIIIHQYHIVCCTEVWPYKCKKVNLVILDIYERQSDPSNQYLWEIDHTIPVMSNCIISYNRADGLTIQLWIHSKTILNQFLYLIPIVFHMTAWWVSPSNLTCGITNSTRTGFT